MLRTNHRVGSLLQALADFDCIGKTDGQLLEQFLTVRDEAAFTALIRRHGPMVLGVCRRILGNAADADDAFQATFLVLVRKAPSLVSRPVLGDWLHGVARRTALKAQRAAMRRRERERVQVRVSVAEPPRNDWLPLLDEELTRLPEKYRLPIVLCDLEEKTRREAAAALGWPEGTVAGRLARGRALLAKRLIRSVQVHAGVLSGVWAAESTLSAGLIRATVQAALSLAAGDIPTALPPATLALAQGVIHSMFLRKLTAALAIVVCVGLFGAGLGVLTNHGVDARPAALPAEAPTIVSASRIVERAPADGGAIAVAQAEGKADEIQEALRKAVKYLKEAQANGNWETQQTHVGGYTSLALWALLEAGIKTDDPAVAKGLDYLRTVEPKGTYVVSLQTMVFCRAGLKRDQDLIRRNATWLLEAMVKDKEEKCLGWTYVKGTSTRTDNSNTQYAVMALDVAAKAGIPIEAATWQKIKDYYLDAQFADGGWGYVSRQLGYCPRTLSMTSAGLAGLVIVQRHLQDKTPKTLDKGFERLAELYHPPNTEFGFYPLHSLGRAASLGGRLTLENQTTGRTFDWRQDIRRTLLQTQAKDGSWRSNYAVEAHPTIATSFAVLILCGIK